MIVKSKTIECNLSKIWNKWTTHEGLRSFFGADNQIDLKLNGAFEIYFLLDNPIGLRGSENCKIISFLPQKMLSFTWNAPPNYPKIRNHQHKTWVVVHFHAIDQNRSKIELHHLGWLKGERWNEVYQYFDSAWEIVLENLAKSCAIQQ